MILELNQLHRTYESQISLKKGFEGKNGNLKQLKRLEILLL